MNGAVEETPVATNMRTNNMEESPRKFPNTTETLLDGGERSATWSAWKELSTLFGHSASNAELPGTSNGLGRQSLLATLMHYDQVAPLLEEVSQHKKLLPIGSLKSIFGTTETVSPTFGKQMFLQRGEYPESEETIHLLSPAAVEGPPPSAGESKKDNSESGQKKFVPKATATSTVRVFDFRIDALPSPDYIHRMVYGNDVCMSFDFVETTAPFSLPLGPDHDYFNIGSRVELPAKAVLPRATVFPFPSAPGGGGPISEELVPLLPPVFESVINPMCHKRFHRGRIHPVPPFVIRGLSTASASGDRERQFFEAMLEKASSGGGKRLGGGATDTGETKTPVYADVTK